MGEIARKTTKKPEAKSEKSVSQKRQNELSQSINSPVEQILYLQRTIGNQAVQRMVRSGALQAKLRIGQPGDVYEQEADRVADAVMRMPEPGVQRQVEQEEEEEEMLQAKPLVDQITPLVQRQVKPEEEEEDEELQAKATSDNISEANPNLESHIQSLKGGGQLLSENDRAFFEPRFNADFRGVKVHTDSNAAHLAHSVNAKAFTVGRDVIFGSGQFSPETAGGKKLLAHELTHVVQQNGGPTLFSDKGKGRLNRVPNTGRAVSEQDRVQRVPSLQMEVATFTILGLTISELTAIIGTATGVAAAVGMAAQNQGKTGKGDMMELKFKGNYLMTPAAKAQLGNISRVLFLLEMKKLTAAKVSKGNKEVIRETAIGNVKAKVINTLNKHSVVSKEYDVANGDGGRTKSYEPWGAAKLRMDSGCVLPFDFDTKIYLAAQQHGVTIAHKGIEFIKSLIVDYDYQNYNPFYKPRDDIYVRGHSMKHIDIGGNLKVLCSVAFDWDDDTTYLEWKGSNAIQPDYPIFGGTWVGSSDPDD